MKLIALTLLLGAVLTQPVCLVGQTQSQKDQALLTQFAGSNPCPRVVPPAWLRPDSTLGHSIYCPVVAVGAATLAADPDSAKRWVLAHVMCTVFTRFEATDMNDGSTSAGWAVTFVVDSTRMANVYFNRQTGVVSTYEFPGSGNRPRKPPCRPGV